MEASFFELGGNSLRAVACAPSVRCPRPAGERRRRAAAADDRGAGPLNGEEAATLLCSSGAAARGCWRMRLDSWNQSQLLTVHVVDGATAAYNIPMKHWVDGPLGAVSGRCAWHGDGSSRGAAYDVRGGRRRRLRAARACTLCRGRAGRLRRGCAPSAAGQMHRGCGLLAASSCCLGRRRRAALLVGAGRGGCTSGALVRICCVTCTTWHLTVRRRTCLSASLVVHDGLRHGGCGVRLLPLSSVRRYALWQRSEALAPQLASHRSYWRSTLREGDLPVLELPLDHPRPAVQTFAGDAVPFRVGGDVVSRLEA